MNSPSEGTETLKDRLFQGSCKSIWDSVKYHHVDAKVDYMTFLEECRKAEDEDRIGQSKCKGKFKEAAATIPSTQSDESTKQLKKQQQQTDTLVDKMKTLVTTLQTAQVSTSFRQGSPSFGMKGEKETHTLMLPCSCIYYCIYYYATAYNTPDTQNYDCISYDIRSNPE